MRNNRSNKPIRVARRHNDGAMRQPIKKTHKRTRRYRLTRGVAGCSHQRMVLRAVGKFVTLYKKEPTTTSGFVRNGDAVNAAMANLVRVWEKHKSHINQSTHNEKGQP